MNQDHIRNFAIIAHIDHGKSTLADRLLEMTGTVQMRDMHAQLLDSNPIERERGITIKLAPVRMEYQLSASSSQPSATQNKAESGKLIAESYILNLIDTPGHVDFGYEVSRSLAACEGAVLVVDATQGVQAQTLANLHQARMHNLVIIPVINKIDMPNARIEETISELRALEFRESEILQISAKTGLNVEKVLEAIVARVPPPRGEPEKPLRALIFSSQYDAHKGVVVFVRVVDGFVSHQLTAFSNQPEDNSHQFSANSTPPSTTQNKADSRKLRADRLLFMASGAEVAPIEVGYFMPAMVESQGLGCGEVGYIATGLKDIRFAKVGDTITSETGDKGQGTRSMGHSSMSHVSCPTAPLPGYKEPKSMVFLGLFPIAADDFTASREAMERLQLSDSAFTFRTISSLALGNGFHCGFLGLLHAEIVQERILREFGMTMIATAPSVEYRVKLNPGVGAAKAGLSRLSAVSTQQSAKQNQVASGQLPADSLFSIQSASEYPDPSMIAETREPVMQVSIFSPRRYVGAIMQLSQEKRGEYIDLKYTADQAEFTYLIPLSEMIIDFFDRLKSVTEGYASLDYEFYEYQVVEVDKVDILVNKEKVDALGFLIVHDQAIFRARAIVERLAAVIPRQQFEVPIQGAIGGQVIARADVKSFRKDVIAKLYGGDRSRKDKLLDKQKKGKAKMKRIGSVEIPQTAFFEVLKRG